jgi:hypothetical protein
MIYLSYISTPFILPEIFYTITFYYKNIFRQIKIPLKLSGGHRGQDFFFPASPQEGPPGGGHRELIFL